MTTTNESVESLLPLKATVFHILFALAAGHAHGYGVIQSVRERSEGRVRLETGSFYRHLRKLLDSGLVEDLPDRPADADPRRGAYYRLTELGRAALAAEAARMARMARATAELVPGGHAAR